MKKHNGKRIIDLIKQIKQMEGTRIMLLLENLRTSQFIMNRNYAELLKVFDAYEKDVSIWFVENRSQLNRLMMEFTRLLHNYLSSLFSLIGHTYAFLEDLGHENFKREYQKKLSLFKNNDNVNFLRDLRTYAQHRQLPIASASMTFHAPDVETGMGAVNQWFLTLEKMTLLEWKKWSSASKRVMEKHESDIELKNILQDYQHLIKEFYQWLDGRVLELFSEDIGEFERVQSEILRLQSKAFPELDNG